MSYIPMVFAHYQAHGVDNSKWGVDYNVYWLRLFVFIQAVRSWDDLVQSDMMNILIGVLRNWTDSSGHNAIVDIYMGVSSGRIVEFRSFQCCKVRSPIEYDIWVPNILRWRSVLVIDLYTDFGTSWCGSRKYGRCWPNVAELMEMLAGTALTGKGHWADVGGRRHLTFWWIVCQCQPGIILSIAPSLAWCHWCHH